MNPEVERLFSLAAGLPASRQQSFLREECPDPAIRAEVEALLRDSGDAEAFFDAAIREVASSLNEINEP